MGKVIFRMNTFRGNNDGQRWFYKYKIHHILFWFLYNYVWWAVTVGSLAEAAKAIFFSPFAVKFGFYLFFQAAAASFNLYFLIPKFLEKSRFIEYFIYLLVTILCTAALIVPGYYLTAFCYGRTVQEVYNTGPNSFYHLYMGSPLPSTVASMTIAMSIKLAKNWLQTQRKQQALEKEKLETELNFLKYQFNPHFLFNTINSIFFLIHKNPDMASASLAKFSDILRYQLYECNDKQILLSKEITCLENSVQLEKLRQNDNIKVALDVNHHNIENLGIAPFILMTFIENAFKHVSKHTDQPNHITIQLKVDQQQLYFVVSNSCSTETSHDVVNYGGIGLKNVKRRLDLIYPDLYQLNIDNNGNNFEVRLHLNLNQLVQTTLIQNTSKHSSNLLIPVQ